MKLLAGRVAALTGTAVGLLAGCTPSTPSPIITTTVVTTLVPAPAPKPTPTPTFHPPPARFVPVLPGDGALPAGQRAGSCPYIDTQSARNLEGNRIGPTTINSTRPIVCTFYYAYAPVRATLQIAPSVFASNVGAYNAMVLTGEAGAEVDSRRNIVPGVDAVLYRTKFYGPDGGRNWACSFAKGRTMVTVRTDRTDTSYNALQIAIAVVTRF
jgi:hypothetical protein